MNSSPNNRQIKALIYILPTVQAPKDDPPPSSHWESIIQCLNGMLSVFKEYHVCCVTFFCNITDKMSHLHAPGLTIYA